MKEKKYFPALVAALLVALFFLPSQAVASPTQKWLPPKPQMITISEFDIGTYLYPAMGAVASEIKKKFGISIRIIPIGNSVARAISTRSGATQFWKSCSAYYACMEGVFDFAKFEWGPQPLRLIYPVKRKIFFSPAARADSGIKKIEDVKGKKVAWIVGNPTINMQIEAWLAFGGLSTEDIKKVDFPGYTASLRGLLTGKVDVCATTPTNPVAQEISASPHGLSWIPFPENNVDGWKRMREIAPFLVPITLTEGAGITPGNPVTATTYPCPVIVAWETQDQGLCYWLVKSIVESYDGYKGAAATLPAWELKNSTVVETMTAPYHDGIIKYFKEIGIWTEKHEKRQQALLKRQNILRKAFQDTRAEFAEKALGAKEFNKFWNEKRVEALKAAGLSLW